MGRESLIRAHAHSNLQWDPPATRPSPSGQKRCFCDFSWPSYRVKTWHKGQVLCSWLQPLRSGYSWACWHCGSGWCMFAVSAEITRSVLERAPPAEQYVLHPSGCAVCRSARRNFHPPSTWQGRNALPCSPTGGCATEPPSSFSLLWQENHSLLCIYLKKGKRGKKEEKEKESQLTDCIHHDRNWRRSWLVDDWFMSACCKPRERGHGNTLIYLCGRLTQALQGTAGQADMQEAAPCPPQRNTHFFHRLMDAIAPHHMVFSHHRQALAGQGTRTHPFWGGKVCICYGATEVLAGWMRMSFAHSCVTAVSNTAGAAVPQGSQVVPHPQHTHTGVDKLYPICWTSSLQVALNGIINIFRLNTCSLPVSLPRSRIIESLWLEKSWSSSPVVHLPPIQPTNHILK